QRLRTHLQASRSPPSGWFSRLRSLCAAQTSELSTASTIRVELCMRLSIGSIALLASLLFFGTALDVNASAAPLPPRAAPANRRRCCAWCARFVEPLRGSFSRSAHTAGQHISPDYQACGNAHGRVELCPVARDQISADAPRHFPPWLSTCSGPRWD